MSSIQIVRSRSGSGQLRKIIVEVDGQVVGRLSRGGLLNHDVEPGPHTVTVRMDWVKKNLTVNVAAGQFLALRTGTAPKSTAFSTAFTQGGRNYLLLGPDNGDDEPRQPVGRADLLLLLVQGLAAVTGVVLLAAKISWTIGIALLALSLTTYLTRTLRLRRTRATQRND